MLLRLNGVDCEPGAKLVGPVHLEVLGTMKVGARTIIQSGAWANPVGSGVRASIVVKRGAHLTIGADVGGSNCEIYCWSKITIGDRTLIGGGTRIYDSNFHALEPEFRNPDCAEKIRSRPIHIGSDVFIGGGAIILKGVTIGDGAVIGAGSVVSKSVPPREIWVGNPARFAKSLDADSSGFGG